MTEKWINTTTHFIICSTSRFYNLLLFTKIQNYKKILYELNCMNWKWSRVRGDLQGNLTRELVFNCLLFSQPPSTLASDHNPSYPGVGPPPPQRPGLQDNGKFGVAWVIYRIQMQTQINPLGFKIELKSLTVG